MSVYDEIGRTYSATRRADPRVAGDDRPATAPVVRASAERLPLDDGSVDAAMAIPSDHHWRDRVAGSGR